MFPSVEVMRRALIAVIGALALVGTTAGATVETGTRHAMQADADKLLRYGAPGVLAELETGRGTTIRVRSGYGDVDRRTPVPWDARFRIGSFTKTYVSATVLQLVGEGKLSLADTVDHWLPGVVRGNGNDGTKITVRQLLQHTSGLTDYLTGYPWLFSQEGFEQHRFDSVTAEEAVATAMTFPPQFAPGAKWDYSNTNYQVAGLIIKAVTGHDWRTEVRNRIVRPLGLRHTYLPGNNPDIPGPHAVGYERFPGPDATEDDPDYGDAIDATRQNPTWGGAAGEMISTAADGNRFLKALIGGRVLKPAQLAEMQRTVPASPEFQTNWPGVRYGLGLMFVPNPCGGEWAHGGDIMGFQTRNGVSADGRRSVIVSINTDSLKRDPGVPKPAVDITTDLINDALCGA
ncbi:D-alanyl-D-alanine carboxypeptidase [Paractinoplanes toevensis]|uniref:D-alanyl-D-alanine carboxypeptidase n=2 Tax=Paractinoplanes toevensis TaxID=571911 RepID=A0A919T4J7_9ACTN|nr:D-alanyl-D-alanine carboxypeptidase [Actinoplanes toevensis]